MSASNEDQRLLAVLGRGLVPYDSPILRADDLGALRGDGIFETTHIRSGLAWCLDEHLERMAVSAAKLALALPSRDELAGLAAALLAAWPTSVEGSLRLICTRGAEVGGSPTVYGTAGPVAPAAIAARRDGVRVLAASLGFRADARSHAPWLLGGAKTLSYAVNMATLRWAEANNVQDVLWTSEDGYVFEAPTSSLVWLTGTTLWTVPSDATGVLPSITVRYLFEHAKKIGFDTGERLVKPSELESADGVWLASSVRGIVDVTSIDGVSMARSSTTRTLQELLGFTA